MGALFLTKTAMEVGLHPATLRRWERMGLLNVARDERGWRIYGPSDLERILQIKKDMLARREEGFRAGLAKAALRRKSKRGGKQNGGAQRAEPDRGVKDA